MIIICYVYIYLGIHSFTYTLSVLLTLVINNRRSCRAMDKTKVLYLRLCWKIGLTEESEKFNVYYIFYDKIFAYYHI